MWYNNIKRGRNERFDQNTTCMLGFIVIPQSETICPQNTNAPHGYPPCGATFLPFLTLKTIKSVLFDSKPVARKTSLKVLTTGKNASIFRQNGR